MDLIVSVPEFSYLLCFAFRWFGLCTVCLGWFALPPGVIGIPINPYLVTLDWEGCVPRLCHFLVSLCLLFSSIRQQRRTSSGYYEHAYSSTYIETLKIFR